MISLTQMVSGRTTVSTEILVTEDAMNVPARPPAVAVWNVTSRCNLRCTHCYAAAGARSDGELTTDEALGLVEDLSALGVKVLILSGGEPLLREDIFDISHHGTRKGLMVILSSNGTLIDEEMAGRIKHSGVKYVGVSLDGLAATHDLIRGSAGGFEEAARGIRKLTDARVRAGVRFTVMKDNLEDLPGVVRWIERTGVPRICVYHLVRSGRANDDRLKDIGQGERAAAVDFLLGKAIEWKDTDAEIETVAFPGDGVHAYLWLKRNRPDLASSAARYLTARGGDPSGDRLLNIDHLGNVHPNQFWWDLFLGNVRDADLEELWWSQEHPVLAMMREKHKHVKGRCGRCQFKQVCGGFRLRALRSSGDLWAEDPSCYIGEEAIRSERLAL